MCVHHLVIHYTQTKFGYTINAEIKHVILTLAIKLSHVSMYICTYMFFRPIHFKQSF